MLSARDFELLLPWYLNGTLTDRERALVADYLKTHPEEDARVQWNASLRAGIKEQADALPEDLGLDRILAAVNRDKTRARSSQRAGNERHVLSNLAAWVASFGRSRGKLRPANLAASADSLNRAGGAVLGRLGIWPWVAAVASLAIVAGTAVVLMSKTIGPTPAPSATVAESRTPIPAPADETASLAAGKSREDRAPGELAKLLPPSSQRADVAEATGPTPAKSGATPGSPRRPRAPTLKAPTDETTQVADGKNSPSTRREPSKPTEGESQPTQLAMAPISAATPPSEANRVAPSSASVPPTDRASGSQTALEAASPAKQPATLDVSATTSVAKVFPTQSEQREIASERLAAISGKANTSCPSTDKQREDALRAANPDQPVRTPADWLEYIRQLRKAGCREAADKEWVEFRKKYPNEKVPPEFTSSP